MKLKHVILNWIEIYDFEFHLYIVLNVIDIYIIWNTIDKYDFEFY